MTGEKDLHKLLQNMSPELIDRAWSNMFVRDETIIR